MIYTHETVEKHFKVSLDLREAIPIGREEGGVDTKRVEIVVRKAIDLEIPVNGSAKCMHVICRQIIRSYSWTMTWVVHILFQSALINTLE